MQEKILQTYLSRVILFLRDKYDIDVQLVDSPLSIARQVAQWSNSRLEESGLIHQCSSYGEVFDLLPEVISDDDILSKLKRRKEHVLENRYRLLGSIKQALSL